MNIIKANRSARTAKFMAAVIELAAAFSATTASADSITDYVHLELGAGVSRYGTQGDNTWYQQGMPHQLGLSAPVLSAGFTGPLYTRESWGIDWHVNYVSLGHVSSDCTCTPMDQNYSTKTHQKLGLYNVPDANFVGNGNAQGISITVEPYFKYQGWRLGAEAGLYPYRPDWDVTVYNWAPGPGVPTSTIHADTPHAWQLGKVVGLSVGRGPLSLSYQHYWLPTRFDSAHSPAIWSGADVLMVKYRF
jgi:hypothetical protein